VVVSLKATETYPSSVVRLVKDRWPWVSLLLVDGPPSAQMATATLRAGADDYLLDEESTAEHIADAIERAHRRRPFASAGNPIIRPAGEGKLIGTSDAMQPVFERIGVAHKHDFNVLLHGESGTGKTLTARAIHAHSARDGAPFVSVDCRCLSPDRARQLFFGTEEATGDDRRPPVSFQDLKGGTVVLDHIDEMKDEVQDALVHVLETTDFRDESRQREEPAAASVRFVGIMSTSPPPSSFRTDLYYHLAELPVFLPPLRERTDDIGPLARFFLKQQIDADAGAWSFSDEAQAALREYAWPGNVRQLENVVERAVHVAADTTIEKEDLILPEHPPQSDAAEQPDREERSVHHPDRQRSVPARHMNGTAREAAASDGLTFGDASETIPSMEELKKQAVKRAYEVCDGDVDRAAVELDIGRSTMYRMLDRYDLKDD
jgi:DNA-binding NtrC family response regulator